MPVPIIDMHVHVGLAGDKWPHLGGLSEEYRRSLVFQIFLKYACLSPADVQDETLHRKTLEVIAQSHLDKAVCLALDPIYDAVTGARMAGLSHMWVDNRYIVEQLRPDLPDKILFGASVHPYDPSFRDRVDACVADDAVLMKWLPSAQQINLADPRAGAAMKYLARAKGGRPLPLLLHTGPEYAIPPRDPRTKGYDYLSWTWWDAFWNGLRFNKAWYRPDIDRTQANIKAALDEGAVIIFAHCGTPYFSSGLLENIAEHSDFKTIKSYLERTARREFAGRCYADLAAFVTPTRVPYVGEVRKLPPQLLLFGSDFPVPLVELSAGPEEWWKDFKAVIHEGKLDRAIVPEGNLLDVNYRELRHLFGDHPLFTNFNALLA